MKTNIRWQEKVDRPYEAVLDAFLTNAQEMVQGASSAAGDKTATELHSTIGGVEFHHEVLIKINRQVEIAGESNRRMILDLEWKSADSAFLFPTMEAKLFVVPVGGSAQLDFRGEYDPPLGVLGQAVDAVLGVKVAESSVKYLLLDIAERLRAIVPESSECETVTC